MSIMEKLDYLIEYLLKENKEINIDRIPSDIDSKKRLYRSLCNIRNAKPISNKYLEIENKYLQEELKNKQVTNVNDIEILNMKNPNTKIFLWQGDITTLKIEAIVNAANSKGLRLLYSLS